MIAFEHHVEVGERFAAMGDEIGGARQAAGQHRRGDERCAHRDSLGQSPMSASAIACEHAC